MKTNCSGWCWPTIIYITLSLFGLVLVVINDQRFMHKITFSSEQEKYKYIFKNLIQQLFWTFVLFMLCSRCKHNIAWGFLFLPVIVLLFIAVLLAGITVGGKANEKNTGKSRGIY
jgi:cell division protein FtsW (lipid II flippase)